MESISKTKIIRLTVYDSLKTILYWPIWWYSKGLKRMAIDCYDFVAQSDKSLGFLIWLKNLFVPMFGQKDIAGKIISFFLRLSQVIFRGIIMIIVIALAIAVFCVWLILPIFIIYQIIINLIHV